MPKNNVYKRKVIGSLTFVYKSSLESALSDLFDHGMSECSRVAKDLGVTRLPGIEVRVAKGLAEFMYLQPKGADVPSWAVGVAHPGLDMIVINFGRTKSGDLANADSVLAHELSHVLLHHAVGGQRIPRWFDEGMAMREAGEWSFWRARALMGPTLTGGLIPLKNLDLGFPLDEEKARLAYAESVEFVAWLFEDQGIDKVHALLAGLRDGKPFLKALVSALGMPLRKLEAEWRSYLKMRFSWIPLLTSSAVMWFLISIVFLLVYFTRRTKSRRRLEAMELEDTMEVFSGFPDDDEPPPGRVLH
ncbi:MAG: hypothetical protein GXP49_11585 [Deltaproteobacteria bacterium]|nr:hypothetical protein [Deltaproteobacteria bacterium]